MNIYQVIKRPLVTEKSSVAKETLNKYAFEVSSDATKDDVKRAVESLFKVSVTDVCTANVRGKTKRVGRSQGRTSAWKKAVVTLKQGDAIQIIEGV